MTTKEISEINRSHAIQIVELQSRFSIPRTDIDKFIEKVARLTLLRQWAPFQKDLLDLKKGLEEYRIHVCQKTDQHLAVLRSLSLPRDLLTELNHVGTQTKTALESVPSLIDRMLSNPAWAPYHSTLAILKTRAEEISKKRNIDNIDRIGIAYLFREIESPEYDFFSLSECSQKMKDSLWACNIEQTRKQIEARPKDIFSVSLWGILPLNAACSFATENQLAMIQLLVRAGANVNGGFLWTESNTAPHHIRPPLCDAYVPLCGRDQQRAMAIPADINTHKEILELLLRSGANPNLPTPPVVGSLLAPGFSTVLHNIIAQTDERADELLPTLVDAGMNVDALQGCLFGDCGTVEISTPLMRAISYGCLKGSSIPQRVNFIRALTFNNAIVHEATKKRAERFNCLEHLNKYVQIRDRVLNETLEPVRLCLQVTVIVELVTSYWRPNIPDMRQRCYVIADREVPRKVY